jgi:hypothetical protein
MGVSNVDIPVCVEYDINFVGGFVVNFTIVLSLDSRQLTTSNIIKILFL